MCPSDNIKKLPNLDKSPPQEVNHDMSREDFLKGLDSVFDFFEANHQIITKKIVITEELFLRDTYDKDDHDFDNFASDLIYNKCLLAATDSLHIRMLRLLDNSRSDQSRDHSTNLYLARSMLRMFTKVHEIIFDSIRIYTGDC